MGLFGTPGPQPQYVVCDDCGQCVHRDKLAEHKCDSERVLDYELVKLRPDIYAFEHDFYTWLALSPDGQFERYYAERDRLRSQILGRKAVAA